MVHFDVRVARKRIMLQLNEVDNKLRLLAYESSCVYKERNKHWHHKYVMTRGLKKVTRPFWSI